MIGNFRNIFRLLILIYSLCIHSKIAYCQNSNSHDLIIDTNTVSYFYEPYPQIVGSSIFQIGGSFSFIPTAVVENEFPIPAIDLQYKSGVFNNISFDATLSTNFFANILHLGPQGNYNFGRYSIGLSNHIGAFYGFLTYEGQFDQNWAYSIFYMPAIRLGYRFDDFSISSSWVSAYLLKTVSKVGNMDEIQIYNGWNDFYCTIAVEQPFLKQQQLSLGFSLAYTRTPYQSWMLYNTIDEYMLSPEFFFAFQL